jgi:hypothetical protein
MTTWMAPLCAEFGISRKTGYKIFDGYKDCGVVAFRRSEPGLPSMVARPLRVNFCFFCQDDCALISRDPQAPAGRCGGQHEKETEPS